MACSSIYTIESDKMFLNCDDNLVLGVYEIDNLYLTAVQQKHWTFVASLNFGEDREYEAVRFGDMGIIEVSDLQRLMDDLKSLGIMVNREGLCFLKRGTEGSTSSSSSVERHQLNCYRLFDQFDWSNYGLKVKANTRWICNDIVTGRPMFEREIQLVESKHLLMAEMMELKLIKHIADMEQLKRKMEEKLTMKEAEQVDEQVLAKALETLAGVVECGRYLYPSKRVRLLHKETMIRNDWKDPIYKPDVCIVLSEKLLDWPLLNELLYHGNTMNPELDKDNWWAVRVVRVVPVSKRTYLDTIIYYDGECSHIAIPSSGSIPVPMHSTEFEYVSSGLFFNVVGVGVRYGFPVKDDFELKSK